MVSRVWLFATPWIAACQTSLSFIVSQSLVKFMLIELIMLSISSSATPFSLCLHSFPASGSFLKSRLFTSGGQRIGSFSFSINPSNECSGLISFKDWLIWFPCSPKDSQAFSPQFKTINSLVLSLCSPTLTSIHDQWKNHSFDYMGLH